jgi:hypothetical protein
MPSCDGTDAESGIARHPERRGIAPADESIRELEPSVNGLRRVELAQLRPAGLRIQ